MHAAYIEAESRLKRHRARLVHARIVSRHESSYDIVRRVETGERGGGEGGRRCSSGVACLELVLSGATLSAKGPKG